MSYIKENQTKFINSLNDDLRNFSFKRESINRCNIVLSHLENEYEDKNKIIPQCNYTYMKISEKSTKESIQTGTYMGVCSLTKAPYGTYTLFYDLASYEEDGKLITTISDLHIPNVISLDQNDINSNWILETLFHALKISSRGLLGSIQIRIPEETYKNNSLILDRYFKEDIYKDHRTHSEIQDTTPIDGVVILEL